LAASPFWGDEKQEVEFLPGTEHRAVRSSPSVKNGMRFAAFGRLTANGKAMPSKRTTHRSSKAKKLYAERDGEGQLEDVQTYERAHGQDVKRRSKAAERQKR
jgi:hypothetical protein